MKSRPYKGTFIVQKLLPEELDSCKYWSIPSHIGKNPVGPGSIWECGYCGRKWELRKTPKKNDFFKVRRGMQWMPISPAAPIREQDLA